MGKGQQYSKREIHMSPPSAAQSGMRETFMALPPFPHPARHTHHNHREARPERAWVRLPRRQQPANQRDGRMVASARLQCCPAVHGKALCCSSRSAR